MNDRILLAFSGGLDSTYLLYSLLESGERNIDLVRFELANNPKKTKAERLASKKIIKFLNGKYNVNLVEKVHKQNLMFIDNCDLNFSLVMIILNSLLYSFNRHKKVLIGYTLGDDAVSYLQEINKIWKSFEGIMDYKLPKIEFPLIKQSKKVYYHILPEELQNFIHWCELDSCFEKLKCKPCRRMEEIIIKESV